MARHRWPDAQIKVTVAKWDLGKKQQREKKEKRREKREERWFVDRKAGVGHSDHMWIGNLNPLRFV